MNFSKVKAVITLSAFLLIAACSTAQKPADENAEVMDAPKMSKMVLVSRDAKSTRTNIDDQETMKAFYAALENRERRYEKLMPLFEYQFSFDMDGETQTWKVNKGGYLMKSDSSELYKIDVTALAKYMK